LANVDWDATWTYVKEQKPLPMRIVRSFLKNPHCHFCNGKYWWYFAQFVIASKCIEKKLLNGELKSDLTDIYFLQFNLAYPEDFGDQLWFLHLKPGSELPPVEALDALGDDDVLPVLESELDMQRVKQTLFQGKNLPMGIVRVYKKYAKPEELQKYWQYAAQLNLVKFVQMTSFKVDRFDEYHKQFAFAAHPAVNPELALDASSPPVPTIQELEDLKDEDTLPQFKVNIIDSEPVAITTPTESTPPSNLQQPADKS
jgi:hypothetical protein